MIVQDIKDKSISLFDEALHEYLSPDYIYIPIEDNYKLRVSPDASILKNQELLKNNTSSIYSPISGKIIGKTSSMLLNNKNISCLVIENNYKEKVDVRIPSKKYINEYSKTEIKELIEKYNILDENIKTNAKTLIINGLDLDPFEKTYSFIINHYAEKILETIDALGQIMNAEECILVINNKDSKNVISINNYLGTYPNIKLKLIPNTYPISYKDLLIKKLINKKAMKFGVNFLSVEEIYNIYECLKRKQPIHEKLITISGNAVEHSRVVKVKIGTSMSDIVKDACHLIKNNYLVIENGLLMGTTLKNLNNIVTKNTRSIFLHTKNSYMESKCINCGLCVKECPVGLNPKYIMEHKKKVTNKCIKCGLCTYICPSKINLKKYLEGEYDE